MSSKVVGGMALFACGYLVASLLCSSHSSDAPMPALPSASGPTSSSSSSSSSATTSHEECKPVDYPLMMLPQESAFLRKHVEGRKRLFEWGTGGSTVMFPQVHTCTLKHTY